MKLPTLEMNGKTYLLIEPAEYARLRHRPRRTVKDLLPPLPRPAADGSVPAGEYTRALLARKLITARKKAGFTQAELAHRAGVRIETVNRIERAKTNPTIGVVEKLLKAMT